LFKLKTPATGMMLVLSVAVISLYALINGMLINVKNVEIPLSKISSPLRVAHLSDIHVGTIHNSGYLKRNRRKDK